MAQTSTLKDLRCKAIALEGVLVTALIGKITHRAAPSYAGPDRRALAPSAVTTIRFTIAAALLELIVAVVAWQLGERNLVVASDSPRLATLLTAAAIGITVSAGIIAIGRYAISRDRGSLDVGIMMMMLGAGWFVHLRLANPGDVSEAVYRAIAFGIAITVLALVVGLAVRPEVDASISLSRRLSLTMIPPVLFAAGARFGALPLDADQLRNITLPIAAVATVTALSVGLVRHQWLLTFIGLQLLGVQLSELLGMQAIEGNESWLVGAGIMAVAAACMGLYGTVVAQRQYHAAGQAKELNHHRTLQHLSRIAQEEHHRNQDRMHSLRSGLLGVEAVASTIAGAPNPAEVGEVLATEAKRLRQLTSNTPLVAEEFDLAIELKTLVDAHLRQGRAVTLETPPYLYVRAARNETLDAVHLLIDNAVTHGAGSPITVSADWNALHELQITVRDRGPGVPEKMRDKIFGRGVTTHKAGTGIGLHVCRKIAEAQGGELTYESRLGGGSVFTFKLPAMSLPTEIH